MGMNFAGKAVGFFALAISACGGSSDSGAEASGGAAGAAAGLSKMLVDQTAGKACASDKDCGNGSCKQEIPEFPALNRGAQSAPGGFCSFGCRLNVDCGTGGVCIGAGNNAFGFANADDKGLCMAACDESSQCREGYVCVDLFGQALGADNFTTLTGGSCRPPSHTDEP